MGNLEDYLYGRLAGCKFISLTGSGGKTSLLLFLKELFLKHGERVLLTTTTHLSKEFNYGVDGIFRDDGDIHGKSALFVKDGGVKFGAPDIASIEKTSFGFDRVLIEADGSRGLPLKYHSDRDPVIPSFSQYVLAVMGADALFSKNEDSIFGAEGYFGEFPQRRGCKTEAVDFENLLCSANGVLKGCRTFDHVVLLNKFELAEGNGRILSFVAKYGVCPVSVRLNKIYVTE